MKKLNCKSRFADIKICNKLNGHYVESAMDSFGIRDPLPPLKASHFQVDHPKTRSISCDASVTKARTAGCGRTISLDYFKHGSSLNKEYKISLLILDIFYSIK